MEKINNNQAEEGNNETAQAFQEMPRAEKVNKLKALFTSEEAAKLDGEDIEIMLNVARRYLEREKGETDIDDALIVGAIARSSALEMLGGKSFGTFAINKDKQVVTGGASDRDALEKARGLMEE